MKPSASSLPRALLRELERTARDPSDAIRWAERMMEAVTAGDAQATYRSAVKVKQAAPRATSIRKTLGSAAFELERWHEAAQELLAYRRLTGERSVDPIIAECYRRLGRAGRALEFLADLSKTAVHEETWIDAQIVRARALADTGRSDVGRSVLEALRMDPRARGPAQRRAVEALAELRGGG